MVFPTKALVIGLITGVVMRVFGVPTWPSFIFGAMTFMGMGGLLYIRLVFKTLPRDLWIISNGIKVIRAMNSNLEKRLYLSDHFKETVRKHPNKVAIIYEERQITFRELDELSNQIANILRAHGLRRGDLAAVFMENNLEYLAVFLGMCKLGVIAALINYNLRKEALAHCIRIGNCSAVVFSPSLAEALGEVLPELDPALSDSCFSYGEQSILPQARNIEEEFKTASSNDPPPPEEKQATDKACIIYTSGTTGLPKACKVQHVRLCIIQLGFYVSAQIRPDDVIYCTLPLYHTSGMALTSGQMIIAGTTLVIKKKFSASNFWLDCIKYKCTVTFYIGEICRYLLAQPDRPTDTQHSVRMCIGNGLRPQIWTAFTKRFGIAKIAEFYGATEGNVAFMNPFNKVGSCGTMSVVLPMLNLGVLVKVDPETGEYIRNNSGFCVHAGINEPGELVGAIKEHMRITHFEGYTDAKANTKKVMTNVFRKGDRYYRTGDILRMDEEGYVYFCDRTGDTFRWKGENVSTTEVEANIANVLELKDVVVYGVEVPGCEGRAGMAAIVGTETTVDLANLARKLFLLLPGYAVPLFIRLLPEVELTGTFKLKKVQLRNEGFDISHVHDPLYIMDERQRCYVPITSDLYQQISTGNSRL